jgi:hypothetical protein
MQNQFQEDSLLSLTESQGPLVLDPQALRVDLFHRLGPDEWLQVRCFARPVVDEYTCIDTILIEVRAVCSVFSWDSESNTPALDWSDEAQGGLMEAVFPLCRGALDARHEAQGLPLAILASCPGAEDWTPAEVAQVWLAAVEWDVALNALCCAVDVTPWLTLEEQ